MDRMLGRFVVCASAAAALLFAGVAKAAPVLGPPYLVGSETPQELATDLVVDAAGNAYVAGVVLQHDFPGLGTAAWTNGGVGLRFIAKYGPNSRLPTYAAVVGSPTRTRTEAVLFRDFRREEMRGLAVDASGNAYLPAYEAQANFVATGGAYRSDIGPKYVYKVTSAGAVSRHSLALDPAILRVAAVAIDASGALHLTGSATSGLVTTAGAPYPTSAVSAGCIAPFALKLAPSGQAVTYATYLAQATAPCAPLSPYIDPTGFAIAVDAASNAYITGQAEPGLAATAGALDLGTKVPAYFYPYGNTASHAFVVKLGPTGGLVYAARLGGELRDRGTSIVPDAAGNAIVAGKTSSHDFPRAGTASAAYPFVQRDCLSFNPEIGFLSKISPNGAQLLFSTYVPLDGGQLDDCGANGGTLSFQPARVALDASGNMAVAGFTSANNRDLPSTSGAIIPKPSDISRGVGNQLLQIYAPDGSQLLYSTPLGLYGVHGIGFDARQALTIAGGGALQRLVPGSLPVEIAIVPDPPCASAPATINVKVAGAFDLGTVDITSDGTALGSAPVTSGTAAFTTTFASAGVRTLRATYRGPGPFDRQASIDFYAVVNQTGACQ
ncbi:MAG: Ig-like domain-containing protein [Burkholderiales bacterium]